jgi:hypothetical protein
MPDITPAQVTARSFCQCAPPTQQGLSDLQHKLLGASCYAIALDAKAAAALFGAVEWEVFRLRLDETAKTEDDIRARLDALAAEIEEGKHV